MATIKDYLELALDAAKDNYYLKDAIVAALAIAGEDPKEETLEEKQARNVALQHEIMVDVLKEVRKNVLLDVSKMLGETMGLAMRNIVQEELEREMQPGGRLFDSTKVKFR